MRATDGRSITLVQGSITTSSRYLYCIPPHTHALLRYRVQTVTPSHVAYYEDSGVAVDTVSGDVLGAVPAQEAGPIRIIERVHVDVVRSWEGVPPNDAVYYSSVDAYRRLHDHTLVRYGLNGPISEMDEIEMVLKGNELDQLRQRMMDAHPDRGGSEAAFTAAREAYEAARRR